MSNCSKHIGKPVRLAIFHARKVFHPVSSKKSSIFFGYSVCGCQHLDICRKGQKYNVEPETMHFAMGLLKGMLFNDNASISTPKFNIKNALSKQKAGEPFLTPSNFVHFWIKIRCLTPRSIPHTGGPSKMNPRRTGRKAKIGPGRTGRKSNFYPRRKWSQNFFFRGARGAKRKKGGAH